MEIKYKYFLFFGLLTVLIFSCTPVDYQILEVDYSTGKIRIVDSNEYVIDSLVISKFGEVKYSIAIVNRQNGENKIILNDISSDYKTYKNELKNLDCNETDLDLNIYIRKKGSNVKLSRDIANNHKHVDDIQMFRGLVFKPCSNEVVSYEAERRYK